MSRSLALATLFACSIAATLPAQSTAASVLAFGGVDKLLDRIETVNLYYGYNISKQKSGGGRYRVPWDKEFGLEFSFSVGEYGGPTRRALREKTAAKQALEKLRTKEDSAALLKTSAESAWKVTGVTVKKHYAFTGRDTVLAAVDSEFVAAPKTVKTEGRFDLDFAIGYGQLDGIKTLTPYELRGYVRELPSISLYITDYYYQRFGLYAGLRTGVISLQDAKVYVPTATIPQVFTLSATTFQIGAAIGAFIPLASTDNAPALTLELSSMRRNFNSIASNPGEKAPADLLRSMDLSGRSISFGLLFPLPKASK